MGLIPKGWKVGSLGDFLNIKHGFAFKGEFFSDDETDYILLTPGNFCIGGGFKAEKFKYYDGPINSEYILKENDLIISMTDLSKEGDTLGYPAFVPEEKVKNIIYLHNQRIGLVKINNLDNISKYWFYNLLCSFEYRSWILGSASGSTVKHTSPERIKKFKFIFPEKKLINYYSNKIRLIYNKIIENNNENKNLKQIRDTLLPKLLSGEIEIKVIN